MMMNFNEQERLMKNDFPKMIKLFLFQIFNRNYDFKGNTVSEELTYRRLPQDMYCGEGY